MFVVYKELHYSNLMCKKCEWYLMCNLIRDISNINQLCLNTALY